MVTALSTALSILKVITALPRLAMFAQGLIASYLAWLDEKQKEKIDIAARNLRLAKTPEEKRKALDDWFNAGR